MRLKYNNFFAILKLFFLLKEEDDLEDESTRLVNYS